MEDEGPKNSALYDWWATWGSPDGTRLHKSILGDIDTTTPLKSIDNFSYSEVPSWITKVNPREEIKETLIAYQDCIRTSIRTNGRRRLRYGEPPPPCENELEIAFKNMADRIRSTHPMQAYFISPIARRGKEYIFHSTLHTWRSLDGFRISPLKSFLKALGYIINVGLWLCSIAYLCSRFPIREKIAISITALASFFFIIYFRHVEGRYLLQIYPLLYLMSTAFLTIGIKRTFWKSL
jgi:hypothetical protein